MKSCMAVYNEIDKEGNIMALKKNAHQLFTDREEPRQAFFNTLRKLEENPGSSQVITYYGEGGIGKSWLLADLKRRTERLDSESEESRFADGFVFRGEYVPVLYNFETATDLIEVLCSLRYSLYLLKNDLSFPLFDCAIRRYKEITGKNLAPSNDGNSMLGRYEQYLETAGTLIPQLGPFQAFYMLVKSGGSFLKKKLDKIEDRNLRKLYTEYFEAIGSAETADDIIDNLAEFFKTDLNIAEREYAIVFLIDTFELLTYKTMLNSQRWLTEELAKETKNTLWVFAGRNKIYKDYDNEHLLGDLSKEDTLYYLREKAGIEDEAIIEKIYEITGGTPIFLDLCVQNYRNEGCPDVSEYKNLDKGQLLKRYVKYLSDSERLCIRLMSSMTHWTDQDYKEVFNAVHNNSFTQYLEAYNKVVRSTMIEKDNEGRWFLHRAVESGIYEDPDYPEEIKIASRDELLKLYVTRTIKYINCSYYALRTSELTRRIIKEKQTLSERQIKNLVCALIAMLDDIQKEGRSRVLWFDSLFKDHIAKLAYNEKTKAYILLYSANISILKEEYEKAETEARDAWLAFEKTLRAHHEDTIYAKRLYGISLYHQGQFLTAKKVLEECMGEFLMEYGEDKADEYAASAGLWEVIMSLEVILSDPQSRDQNEKTLAHTEAMMKKDIAAYGENNIITVLSKINHASALSFHHMDLQAISLQNEVFNTYKKIYGENHPETITSLISLSQYYDNAGQLAEALRAAESAYHNAVEYLPENSGVRIFACVNLAEYYRESAQPEQALVLLEEAIRNMSEAGRKDYIYANALQNKADILRDRGQFEEAYEYYAKVFEIYRNVYGENHSTSICCLTLMTLAQLVLKRYPEAIDNATAVIISGASEELAIQAVRMRMYCRYQLGYYNETLTDAKQLYDFSVKYNKTEEKGNALEYMYLCYDALNMRQEALETSMKTLEYLKQNNDTQSKSYASILFRGTADSLELGRYEQAYEFERARYEFYSSDPGKDESVKAESLYLLGFICFHLNRKTEAVHYLEQSLTLFQKFNDVYNSTVAQSLLEEAKEG